MTALDSRKKLQIVLRDAGLYLGDIDGILGPKSDAAYAALKSLGGVRAVLASSFADPADIRAFRACKAKGGTDQECFKVGDNGVGKWGDYTGEGSGPSCALPPEDWEPFGFAARGRLVRVKANGREAVVALKDTMPRLANIKNGAGIDLNPDAAAALGLKPPFIVPATWEWA